ncbi:MAG: hypothetical protein LBL23_05940 [Coriobacteriales bacterium]|jgi:hypothetical protein|nr:hypothetical protein [Coriobacteriales bacterium]
MLSDYTPVPLVYDYPSLLAGVSPADRVEVKRGSDYDVLYTVTGGDTAIAISGTNNNEVSAVSNLYTSGLHQVTVSYDFTDYLGSGDDPPREVSYLMGVDDEAPISIELLPGLDKDTVDTIVVLGDIGTANPSIAGDGTTLTHVAKDTLNDADDSNDVWYVREDASFVVPLEIVDSLLYSTFTAITLNIDDETVTVDGDVLDDLNADHEDTIEITIDSSMLFDIGYADAYPITATIKTVDGEFTTTELATLQVVPGSYEGPEITATFTTLYGGELVDSYYYNEERTLEIEVVEESLGESSLKVPIKITAGTVYYGKNGDTPGIVPTENKATTLTYDLEELPNGAYDFTKSFDSTEGGGLEDIWGQKISIDTVDADKTGPQDLLEFIVDKNAPIASISFDSSDYSQTLDELLTSPWYKTIVGDSARTLTLAGTTEDTGYSGIKSVKYLKVQDEDLNLDGTSAYTPQITEDSEAWDDAKQVIGSNTEIGSFAQTSHDAKYGAEVSGRSGLLTFPADAEFIVYLLVESNNGKTCILASDGTILDTTDPSYSDWILPEPAAYTLDGSTPIYASRTVSDFSIDVFDRNTLQENPVGGPLGSGLKSAKLVNDVENLISFTPSSLADAPDTDPTSSKAITARNLSGAGFSIEAARDYNNIVLELAAEDFVGNTAGGTAPGATETIQDGSLSDGSRSNDISSFSVDTLRPVITSFAYTPAAPVTAAAGIRYFQPGLELRFTVTDANLDPTIDNGVKVIAQGGNRTSIPTPELVGTSNPEDDGKLSYTYRMVLAEEGIYEFAIEAADLVAGADHTTRTASTGVFYIDGTEPEVRTTLPAPVYNSSSTGNDGIRYYDASVTATVVIGDLSFVPSVNAPAVASIEGMAGASFAGAWVSEPVAGSLSTRWTNTVVIAGDGDYRFTIHAEDLAGNGNTAANRDTLDPDGANSGAFIIDTTAPVITIELSPADNTVDNVGYYQQSVTATITVRDLNFSPALGTVVTNPAGSSVSWQPKTAASARNITVGTTSFSQPTDNYSLTVSLSDLAQNRTMSSPSALFTIDHTDPVITVSFSSNNGNSSGGVEYYNASRTATITIDEHNFDARTPDYVNFQPTGPAVGAPGFNEGGDTHTATVAYTTENTAANSYDFSLTVRDRSGRSTSYDGVTPFVVDVTAPVVEFTDAVQHRQAYNDVVTPTVLLTDSNYDSGGKTFSIIGVKSGNSTPSVGFTAIANGEQGVVADAERVPEADDIYTITASLTDLAGNSSEETLTYSVNRFGSTWYIEGATEALVEGRYANAEQSVAVHEVNVNEVNEHDVSVAHDGSLTTLEPSEFTANRTGDEDSWKEHTYTLPASTFAQEGVYEITISTVDAAGNSSSNRAPRVADSACPVDFVIDKTAPTVVITGVEDNASYNEEARNVVIDVQDNIALGSTDAFLNEDSLPVASYTAEEVRAGSGQVSYSIPAHSDMQSFVVVSTDAAGNESEQYAVNNFFINPDSFLHFWSQTPLAVFVSNPPLLYAIVIFMALLAVAILVGVVRFLVIRSRTSVSGDTRQRSASHAKK